MFRDEEIYFVERFTHRDLGGCERFAGGRSVADVKTFRDWLQGRAFFGSNLPLTCNNIPVLVAFFCQYMSELKQNFAFIVV